MEFRKRRKTRMKTRQTNNIIDMQPAKENDNWLLLLLLTSVILGIEIALLPPIQEVWTMYKIPGFGVIGGAIGGIAAGMIRVFSWRISRIIKTILSIVLIASIIVSLVVFTRAFFFLFLIMIPGIVSSLVILLVTIIISTQLIKSPVNWWLFGSLLVVGIIISIVVVRFLVLLGGMFFSQ